MEKNKMNSLADDSIEIINEVNTPVKNYLIKFLPDTIKKMAWHRMSEKDFITVYQKAEKEELMGNGTITEQFISLTEQYLTLQAISSYEKKSVDVKMLQEIVRRWTQQFGYNINDIEVKEIGKRTVSISFKSGEPKNVYQKIISETKTKENTGPKKIFKYLTNEFTEFGYDFQYDGMGNIICKKI